MGKAEVIFKERINVESEIKNEKNREKSGKKERNKQTIRNGRGDKRKSELGK